jgi:hypothetical protein
MLLSDLIVLFALALVEIYTSGKAPTPLMTVEILQMRRETCSAVAVQALMVVVFSALPGELSVRCSLDSIAYWIY